jgi:two-component system nitrogen regulation response regulator GlnG
MKLPSAPRPAGADDREGAGRDLHSLPPTEEAPRESAEPRAADREPLPATRLCAPLLGESRATTALRARIEAAVAVDTPVLLEGERGCGREHLARYLHARGSRRTAAFIRIDAEFADTERAADKLRRAHGGSVLIRDLPHGSARLSKLLAQWLDKNLAGLTSGPLPLRVLATSDVELPRLLDAGLVDAGLLARLGIVRLPVPPLRERAADIPLLCAHFLGELAGQSAAPPRTLSPRAVDQLARYSFPGNLAELRDVIRRSALRARSSMIELGDIEAVLPPLHERVPLEEMSLEAVVRTKVRALLQRLEGYPITDLYEQVLSHIERPLLEEVLARTAGNQLKAAAMLGINRNTLRKKLQERAVLPTLPAAPGPPGTSPADAQGR